MSATTDEKRAKPIEVVAYINLELDPPPWIRWNGDRSRLPRYSDELELWAREMNEFLRDHRSQDAVTIRVERVKETVCSACGGQWETYDPDDNGVLACANCGAVVEKEVVT